MVRAVAGSRIGSVPDKLDDDAARAMPGVLDIIRLPYGVAVVANDIDVARRARERLQVSWTSGQGVSDYDSDAALEDFMRIARDSAGHPGVRAHEHGDPQQGLLTARHCLRRRSVSPTTRWSLRTRS
jgi:isoquinoline 1-oxidoreductase beta subunit